MPGRIGKYEIERELGRGGFGKVYLAFDPDVGQPVAIKKLLAEGDVDLLKRFQMEIRTTAGLRHKNIVTIHASGEEAGDPYLVMEFLEGQTLKQIIQERRPLTLLEKVRIMTQVAEGLGYAHSKGVVHRDVKPENIMLMPDDTVKIMDFGIALGPNRSSAVTQTGGIIGTPPYFAPEQLQGYKASEQTDIFSFGDVYYELLTGVHPFQQYRDDWKSLQIAIMSYEPRAIGDLLPGCPEALETLVHRTLAKEPEFRYQKFEEVRLDSEAIMVDLRQEGASLILREVASLEEAGNFKEALSKINQAYQLAPGNREVRRRRDEINLRLQREQVRARVSRLLEESEKQMSERRYAEAVQTLESAAKLDPSNTVVVARLEEARTRHDVYVRANRLVSEARLRQQKGLLAEADERLQEALTIDPDHTDARRMSHRIRGELERRRLEQQRQQAIRAARDHLAAKRFEEALAVLAAAEKDLPGTGDFADLRSEIQQEQAEEIRRQRAEKFNLALAKTRETMQAGDLERANRMLDHLDANFASDPGAAEVLGGLRERLGGLIRARDIAQYQQNARGLLKEKSFREALDLLAEARRRFPDDAGLARLNTSAEELYQAHRRSEAVAAVLKEATARRDGGDLQGALDTILKGRRDLGDEAAFVDLARQLEIEIEQQRYNAALESLLKLGRELMAAGRYSEAIERLEKFGGEAEVRVLLESARAGAAIEEERRFVEQTLATAAQFESGGKWTEALSAVERGLARYPHNSNLTQTADRLRDRVETERRRSAIESRCAVIRTKIQEGEWKSAEAALRQARVEFPGDRAFDDLARQVESGLYEDGWREVEANVNQHLAANSLSQAQANLEAQLTRTLYAEDPRWKALAQELARRRGYEEALREADRQRHAGRLSEAEELLTEVINQNPPDKRASQMRGAIQVQRSETLRQQGIARIAQEIRERLAQEDLPLAESHLARARARYPGESVWGELQSELDTRQQAVRRKADAASAEESIRRSLERGDVRQASTLLSAARAKYPAEERWAAVEAEINARQAALNKADAESIQESIRQSLERGDIPQASTLLSAARAKYPAEERWAAVESEINARQVALNKADAESIQESIRQSLERGDIPQAAAALSAARAKYPADERWAAVESEINARQAALNKADAESIQESIRQSLVRGDIPQAAAALSAARAKYPADERWAAVEAEINARQAALNKADAESIQESIRQSLVRGDIRQASAALKAARAKYPAEEGWAKLESEINARQAALKRKDEIAAAAEGVRRWLNRTHAGTDPGVLLNLRREDLNGASAELDAARAKYPGEQLWENVRGEIDARRAFVDAESKIAERVSQCLERDDTAAARSDLAAARARYPDDEFWNMLVAPIGRREELLKARAEIARLADAVRDRLKRDGVRGAAAQLAEARAKYPQEPAWAALQTEIDARQSALEREAEIVRLAASIRERLDRGIRDARAAGLEAAHPSYPIAPVWDVLRDAAARLEQARARHPGENLWKDLAAEIAERQGRAEGEITEIVRGCAGLPALDWNVKQLEAARARYPAEPFWTVLKSEIDARREPLDRASKAEFEARIQECLKQEDLPTALDRLSAARKQHPGAKLWDQLQADIDSTRRRLQKREDLDAVERSVREQLRRVAQIPKELDWADPMVQQWEAFQRAAGLAAEARAKYPGEDRLAALDAELGARRAEWQKETAQSITDSLRKYPHKEVVKWFGPQIRNLRAKDPGDAVWARLTGDIEAAEALLKRQAEAAVAGQKVRECLQRDDTRQAVALLNAARAAYPEEPLWPTLQGEIDARVQEVEEVRSRAGNLLAQGRPDEAIALIEGRFARDPSFAELLTRARQALEEKRRREARGRARDRLMEIERQAGTETRKRKRRELDREAQQLAAGYAEDPELPAVATRIHALIEARPAAKPIPWKPIGAGVGVAAAVAAVVLLWPNKKPPEVRKVIPAATIPIEIRTDPPGASLRVGDRTCISNCRLDLAPGTYEVDAELKGYATTEQTLVLDSSNRLVNLKLEPEAAGSPSAQIQDARIELRGAPAHVELRLDGKLLVRTDGSSLFSLPVKPGDRTLEVSSGVLQVGQQPGSRSIRQRFKPGETVQLAWNSGAVPRNDSASTPIAVPGITPSGGTAPSAGTAAGAGTPAGGTVAPPKEDPEERDWSRTGNAASPQQLRDYLTRYPNGRHATEAEAALDGVVWSNTRDNLEALRAYVEEFPKGAHRNDALSRIDDLTWKAVDQNDAAALQKFVTNNTGNRHASDAQKILDRIASSKRDAEKQLQAKLDAENKAVSDTLSRFNAAFAHGDKRGVKEVYPGASNAFLNSVGTAHATSSLEDPRNIVIAGDTATLICNLVTVIESPRKREVTQVQLTLQKSGNGWTIRSLSR